MNKDFDQLLGEMLAPPQRVPDTAFVLRVRAQCALDDRLRAERHELVRRVLLQALALAAVGAGLAWIGRAAPVAAYVERSPSIALAAVLAGFCLLVLTLAAPTSARTRP